MLGMVDVGCFNSDMFVDVKTLTFLKKGDIVFVVSENLNSFSGKKSVICGVLDGVNIDTNRIVFSKVVWSSISDWKKYWPDEFPFNRESGYGLNFCSMFLLKQKSKLREVLVLMSL
jgi:hypothetical protein